MEGQKDLTFTCAICKNEVVLEKMMGDLLTVKCVPCAIEMDCTNEYVHPGDEIIRA